MVHSHVPCTFPLGALLIWCTTCAIQVVVLTPSLAALAAQVVVLDLNYVDPRKIACPYIACKHDDCGKGEWDRQGDKWAAPYPHCDMDRCLAVFKQRAGKAARMLKQRLQLAERHDTQLLVVCHYPGSYLRGRKFDGIDLWALLTSSRVHVTFFGGHVHSTDNHSAWDSKHGKRTVDLYTSRTGWREYSVGGGGGWACDGLQGVVAGEVLSNGRVDNLRFIMATEDECCVGDRGHQRW